MQCPQCGHENSGDAKFCLECGRRLALTCGACGTELPPGAKFCKECGRAVDVATRPTRARVGAPPESYVPKHLAEKILTSKSALEGERKHVTVLFADLKGSMELLADRDPEEARKLLDPVLEHMMEAVHRYEGTINQVMGDGIMALFGAPVAHEDHAVRACYAALQMQDAVSRHSDELRRSQGIEVQIRVGLNSGGVVVRSIGSDLHMDYSAVGQTTHLAARMEQMASPGNIVLTASTLDLVDGFVAVKPLGPVHVKGLVDPVEAYEVTGAGPAKTRLQATAQRGLTRFVGREAELEQFHRAQQMATNGHGQIVAIVGEAGVGKSRLVHEFIHAPRLQGWLVIKVAAISYGKGTSYLPVIDLLKGYFEIQGGDDLREIREKVRGKLLTLDRSLEPTLPALLALLDIPVGDAAWQTLEPGQRREHTFDAVKGLLLREARAQPLLVIFEDLHWIDGETQALLDVLAEGLGSARLLLLVNYRPEYQHGWGSKTYYGQMRLDALPPEGAGELLDALLGDDPTLRPLKQLLVKRGNPFFLEETVRTLVETKALAGEPGRYQLTQSVQVIQVPPTVQAMLAARIDRLSPENKRLLQIASVVGKDVPLELLRAIVELPDEALRRGLDHLQAVELVYETRLFPDPEYSFKHALTHEVAYGGLLQDRRRGLHARIVDAIETLHRDRLGEHTERLAHHAFRAQLREKAVCYLRQAALKAAARSALPEAQSWFEQALAVLGTLPESPSALEQAFDIHLELRPVLHQLGEIRLALDRLRDAEALADRLNDERRRGRVYAIMTNSHALLGELDEALATGARALAIARTLGDLELRVATTSYLEMVHASRGDHERVVELATENLAALPADWQYKYLENTAHTYLFDRFYLIGTLGVLGRFSQAARYEAEAIALAEATQRAYLVGWAHLVAGRLHLTQGDWAKARSLLEGGITVMRQGNVGLLLPHTIASSALAHAQLGEANEALTRFREGTELAEHRVAKGIVESLGPAYTALGRVALLLGRLDAARRFGERALNHTPAGALILLGEIATHPDRFDPDSAAAYYRRALLSAEPRGMRPNVAQCHLGLGKLYRRSGKREQAQEHLTTAMTMYREMDMTFWLEQAEAELKEGT